jgi:hypothetical protein
MRPPLTPEVKEAIQNFQIDNREQVAIAKEAIQQRLPELSESEQRAIQKNIADILERKSGLGRDKGTKQEKEQNLSAEFQPNNPKENSKKDGYELPGKSQFLSTELEKAEDYMSSFLNRKVPVAHRQPDLDRDER